jgi:1,2-dihydroxy-3-keto-5-methylthiopentene dioxygenase
MARLLLIFLCTLSVYGVPQKLRVYHEDHPESIVTETSDVRCIKSILNSAGIEFEQWPLVSLSADCSNDDVLAAYQPEIQKLTRDYGFKTVDVARIVPSNPSKEMLRNKFINEHVHYENEVRFFVEGSGLFYLHLDSYVYLVLCEAGDLISIPPHTKHWFDMSASPSFTAIRFFVEPDGWVGHFTESGISQSFPKYDTP